MSARIQEYREALDRALHDKSKPWTVYFEKLEAQTSVNRVYLFVGKIIFSLRLFISLAVSEYLDRCFLSQVLSHSLVYI